CCRKVRKVRCREIETLDKNVGDLGIYASSLRGADTLANRIRVRPGHDESKEAVQCIVDKVDVGRLSSFDPTVKVRRASQQHRGRCEQTRLQELPPPHRLALETG